MEHAIRTVQSFDTLGRYDACDVSLRTFTPVGPALSKIVAEKKLFAMSGGEPLSGAMCTSLGLSFVRYIRRQVIVQVAEQSTAFGKLLGYLWAVRASMCSKPFFPDCHDFQCLVCACKMTFSTNWFRGWGGSKTTYTKGNAAQLGIF